MYIYGKNVAKEKLKQVDDIINIYLVDNFRDEEILDLIKKNDLRYTSLNNKMMDKMVKGLHQGIIIEVNDIKTYGMDIVRNFNKDKSIIVMLDHLEDPHNFGAIARTCYALGVDAIIIPSVRSIDITSTVVKTSAGAIYDIPVIKVANLVSAIERLKKEGYWIVGSKMNGEDYTKIEYDNKTCLVIGNEGKGISKVVEKNCDYLATIPMEGKIDSLNASVSCGIILAEIKRRFNNG